MTASQTRITLEIGETMKITEKTHPNFEHAVAVDEQVGAVQDAAVVAAAAIPPPAAAVCM